MSYVDEVIERVVAQNPAQPEFHQAVREVLESLRPVVEANEEKFRREALLERLTTPERQILFENEGTRRQSAIYGRQSGFARSPFPDQAHGAGVTVYVNNTAARRLLAIQRPDSRLREGEPGMLGVQEVYHGIIRVVAGKQRTDDAVQLARCPRLANQEHLQFTVRLF